MSAPYAAMTGVPFLLQDTQTTGNGNVLAIPPSFRHHTIIIKGNSTIAAGAIQIETANEYNYAGTWAQVGGGPITVVDGADVVYNFEGVFNFIRARISTTITGAGGSVSVAYEGGKSY